MWDLRGQIELNSIKMLFSRLEGYVMISFVLIISYSFSKLSKSEHPDDNTGKELSKALDKLRRVLYAGSGPQESLKQHRICYKNPQESLLADTFIAFDDAETLAEATINKTNESHFDALVYTFWSWLSDSGLYAFFLSNNGMMKRAKLKVPPGYGRPPDPSSRISFFSLPMPSPYIYLGFDQLMQIGKVSERWNTLEDAISLECAAHMGRPL